MNTNVHTLPIAEHPKAREAREKATAYSRERKEEKEKIKRAVAAHKLHFLSLGRYTFCYRIDKRNVIEISSSIRHPGDKHDPHIGRMQVLTRFACNNRMHLRMPSGVRSPREFLTLMFMYLE